MLVFTHMTVALAMHGSSYGLDHRAGDGHFGQLQGDGAGVTHADAPILIGCSRRLVGDQTAMASGRSMQRRKVAML